MREEIIKLLKQLVEIPSTYPNELAIGNFLVNYLQKNDGIRVVKQEFVKNRFNIIASKGNGEKVIAFYAHMDTVPIVEGWTRNPHQLTLEDDKAYGLGAYDTKGGIVANLITFLENEPPNGYSFKLFICADEEYYSEGGYALIDSEYIKNVACIFSPEPAFMHGTNGVTIGRVGRSVFQIKITRPSCHYMFYEPNRDLNLIAANIIQRLKNETFSETKDGRQFVFVRKIESEAKGMSVPEEVFIELDSAVLPPQTHQSIYETIESICRSIESNMDNSDINIAVNYKSRPTPFLEPYRVDDNNKYLNVLKSAVKTITGSNAKPYFRSSVGDDNIFGSNGLTLLGIGPEGDNAHAPDEWVSISSIEKLIQIYKEFINKLNI